MRQTNQRPDRERNAVHPGCWLHAAVDCFGKLVRPSNRSGNDGGELVTAEAHNENFVVDPGKPTRHLTQDVITDVVTEAVVDLFEVVNVEQQQRNWPRRVAADIENGTQNTPVRKPRERVVVCLILRCSRYFFGMEQRAAAVQHNMTNDKQPGADHHWSRIQAEDQRRRHEGEHRDHGEAAKPTLRNVRTVRCERPDGHDCNSEVTRRSNKNDDEHEEMLDE